MEKPNPCIGTIKAFPLSPNGEADSTPLLCHEFVVPVSVGTSRTSCMTEKEKEE